MEKISNLNERENMEPNSRKRKLNNDEEQQQQQQQQQNEVTLLNGNISPDEKTNLIFVGALPEQVISKERTCSCCCCERA